MLQLVQKHDRHPQLQLELVRRQLSWLLSMSELLAIHAGSCLDLKSVSTAGFMCLQFNKHVLVSNSI